MNAQQTSVVDMIRTVVSTCNANNTAWADFPPFADAFVLLTANLTAIDAAIAIQETDTTGVTSEKNSKRHDMIPGLLKVAAMMRYLGDLNSDDDQARKGAVTKTDLDKATDDSFIGIARRLIDAGFGIGHTTRDAYGITSAFLTTLNDQLTAFVDAVASPRSAESHTQRATKELANLIIDSSSLLEKRLDGAAYLLSDTQPGFYTEYTISREILDPSYNTRALQVNVVGADGQALEAVDAVINPGNIEKQTTENGGFYITNLAAGSYTGIFSRPGFASKTVNFNVVSGIRTDLDVEMDAA